MSWEDERDITRTLVHYCELLDTGQPERIAEEVYSRDIRVGWFDASGREEVGARTVAGSEPFERVVHVLTNVVIDVEGGLARTSSYCTAWHWLKRTSHLGSRPAEWVTVSAYDDELRREPQGWRITSRQARNLSPGAHPVGLGQVPNESFIAGTGSAGTIAPAN